MAVTWNRPNSGGGGGNGVTYTAGSGITIANNEISLNQDFEFPLSNYEENGTRLLQLKINGDLTLNQDNELMANRSVIATLLDEQTFENKTLTNAKVTGANPNCFVETDNSGNIKADREIIESAITESSIQEVLSTSGNWTNGTFGGNLGGTYAGQWFADANYLYFFIADGTPIRLARV